MEKILKCGTTLLFDSEDLNIINSYNWQSNNGYIFCQKNIDGKRKRFYLHRFLTNPNDGQVVDHINGNPSDNRRQNLRLCSIKDNVRNRTKNKHAILSKYKGVRPRGLKFEASIGRNKDDYLYLGTYETEEDAAISYNIAAKDRYGDFANLNKVTFDYSDYTPKKFKGTSKFRGVSFSSKANKWTASIQVNKCRKRIGYFSTEKEAAERYNEEAITLLGNKAKINVF